MTDGCAVADGVSSGLQAGYQNKPLTQTAAVLADQRADSNECLPAVDGANDSPTSDNGNGADGQSGANQPQGGDSAGNDGDHNAAGDGGDPGDTGQNSGSGGGDSGGGDGRNGSSVPGGGGDGDDGDDDDDDDDNNEDKTDDNNITGSGKKAEANDEDDCETDQNNDDVANLGSASAKCLSNDIQEPSYQGGSHNAHKYESNAGDKPEADVSTAQEALADQTSSKSATSSAGSSRRRKQDSSASRIPDLKPAKALVQKYAIRPAPIPAAPQKVRLTNDAFHVLDQKAWMAVFKHLCQASLLQCSEVCKTWHRWAMHHSLWQTMSFSNTHLTQTHLIAIVKRQPRRLDLSWTNVSYRKLDWLLARLPHLKQLDVTGCSWAGVCALCSPSCPLLNTLNLSWVSGLISGCLRDLVSPPVEHRPGVDHSVSRLHHCTSLDVSGSNITASALPPLIQNLPKLRTLRLDSCVKLTDDAIATLVTGLAQLRVLSLCRCHGLTTDVLRAAFAPGHQLQRLEIQNCLKISSTALEDFARDVSADFDVSTGVIVFTTDLQQ